MSIEGKGEINKQSNRRREKEKKQRKRKEESSKQGNSDKPKGMNNHKYKQNNY